MNKNKDGRHGNKEAKKPKQEKAPVSGTENPFAGKPAPGVAGQKAK